MAYTHATSINKFGVDGLVVATDPANGSHTTLAGALADATVGQTVFLRDSVTENVTLPAGINISGWTGGSLNVSTVTGTITMTGAGTSNLSGLNLTTNSAAIIAVTGSAASILNVNDCYLNCSNNTGITYSSSNAASKINIYNCYGDIGTTAIALYSMSATGRITIIDSSITNSGGTSTVNSHSAGEVVIANSFFKNGFSCTGTGIANLNYVDINSAGQNVTCITNTSTTGAFAAIFSSLESGSASCINVSVNCTVSMEQCRLSCTNTNSTTGAGTLIYSNITFGIGGTSFLNSGTNTAASVAESATPAVTVLTSGSGTYTTPTSPSPRYIIVEMVGGGGGGAGSGTAPGAATAGNNSTFGTALLTANGGGAGKTDGTSAAGGTSTGGDINLTGGAGGLATNTVQAFGGIGGGSFYGGFGQPGAPGAGAGQAAAANSGSGGGGAGENVTNNSGGGGGAGGYLRKLISNPLATYAYAVGGTAAGGTLGTGGAAGGLGAAGNIIVTAYFV